MTNKFNRLEIFYFRIVLYCFFALLIPAVTNANGEDDITISQQHYQVPILLQKKENPVLRIHLHIPSAVNPVSLTTITIKLTGSSDWKDIQQVRLYYAGADSGMRNLSGTEKLQLVGSTNAIA